MKLKKIGIGLIAALVVFYLVGFLIPNQHRIVKESHIVAAPKMIFAFIGDLKRWPEWTTWAKMDPNMQLVFSAPTYNIGASQKWKSQKMGEGTMIFTQWAPEDVVGYDLKMDGFPTAHATLRMTPQAQGAMLTWTFDYETGKGSLNRWFGLLMGFFLNRDLSTSLENLRKLCESSIAAEIKAPWVELPPGPPKDSKAKNPKAKATPAPAKKNEPPAVLPMPGAPPPVPPKFKK